MYLEKNGRTRDDPSSAPGFWLIRATWYRRVGPKVKVRLLTKSCAFAAAFERASSIDLAVTSSTRLKPLVDETSLT